MSVINNSELFNNFEINGDSSIQSYNMSVINNLELFTNNLELFNNLGIKIDPNIQLYNKYYKTMVFGHGEINKILSDQLNDYLNNKYRTLYMIEADINYYIEHINLMANKKFKEVINELNLEHILSMLDYCSNIKTNYIYWRNEYYKLFYNKIICSSYKPTKYKDYEILENLINDNWSKINFDYFIEFTKTLNKIIYNGQNIDNYIKLISDKFDSNENIIKLLNYIDKVFFEDFDNNLNENIIDKTSKYNFRFVLDNLKSNGYLIFEEYYKQLIIKYKKTQNLTLIKKDQSLIKYFIYIISKKDSNSVNRNVNELLLRIRNYIYDFEDCYHNNIGYQKIMVKQESDKYKSIDLSSFNRSNATFNIFKYSNFNTNKVVEFNMNQKIEPYFDIYKKFYNSRFPDRDIEFDPFQSTLIVKMNFLEKDYYIHMALIQYIVLDIIFKCDDFINSIDISYKSGINIEYLQETINSLLQIKIIKHNNAKSIEELKFSINNNFCHDNNKISISSLIIKEDLSNVIKEEFMHDRNTIILSNFYDYIKKNKIFTKDELVIELGYKIPFKISQQHIENVIEILINKEHIIEIFMQNSQQLYKLVE